MLLVPDHDPGDSHTSGLLERAHEQPVRLLAALLRHEIVRLAEVDRVDLVEGDEVADLDRVGELDVEPVEILRLERNELPLLELEGAHDVVGVDVLAGVLPHLVVADRLEVSPVDEVETKLTRARRGEHPDRDADEPERDRSVPDRTRRHEVVLPAARTSKTAARRSFSESRTVLLPFTQPIHRGDKPVDGVDSRLSGAARNYVKLL